MHGGRMLLRALGVERTVVEDVKWKQGPGPLSLIVRVRPVAKERYRCSHCGKACPQYDRGAGPGRWRAPDVGLSPVFLEAEAPRVKCKEHGIVTQRTPWARRGSRFTEVFEDRVAWFVGHTNKTTLVSVLGIAWRTVGTILGRVSESMKKLRDPFANVTRIGIDEVSYRKGHRYLTVVVDHDSGRLLWAQKGHDKETLRKFFDELGAEGSAAIEFVSSDAAGWIHDVVAERCPNATLCLDPFHVVQWVTKAVDEVRREVWNELRKSGQKERAKALKGSRWALLKNFCDINDKQRATLADIERDNKRLYRAYLLKEELRSVFQEPDVQLAKWTLDDWLQWASRSRLKPFVKVARTIRKHRAAIDSVLEHGLSNARVEAMNTKLRLLTRMAFGYHSPKPLIALAMIKLGGLCPPLPARP